jgi:carbonic anhydrase/acetyltransferase-like protein (isoleucine patch superfamily)
MGAVLLSGSEIGEGCIIAAGTLVTQGRRIPPHSMVMGSPGKVIRPTTPEEVERTRSICARYLALARRYIQGAFPPWGFSPLDPASGEGEER